MHTRDYADPGRDRLGEIRLNHRISQPGSRLTSGDRNQIREELPLSTRVHELAKELGLKSAELLERIQGWGLDVKASNFASLDPATVDRIRELSAASAIGPEPPRRCRAAHRVGRAGSAAVGLASPARPTELDGAAGDQAGHGHSAGEPGPTVGPEPTAGAVPRRVRRFWPRAAARPRRRRVDLGLVPDCALPDRARRRIELAAARSGRGRRQASPAPLARHGGFSSSRAGGGPLSAHTPHRGTGPRPGSSAAIAGRPAGAEARAARAFVARSTGAAPGGFQPLKPGDYMSSAGIRTMTPRVSPAPPPSSASRRPAEGGGEGGRRDSAAAERAKDRPFRRWRPPARRGRRLHRGLRRRAPRSRPSGRTNR